MLLNREKGGRLSCFQCGNTDLILTHDGKDDEFLPQANITVDCPACSGECWLLEEDEMQLSDEVLKSLEEARKEYKEGKFVSFDELVKKYEEEERQMEEEFTKKEEEIKTVYRFRDFHASYHKEIDDWILYLADGKYRDWDIGNIDETYDFINNLRWFLEKIENEQKQRKT